MYPVSPPMTPEDLHTIAIPEDLFQYEPPISAIQDSILVSPPTPNTPSFGLKRGRGSGIRGEPTSALNASESSHIGNGIPCRFLPKRGGCARGARCAFSHAAISSTRRTALEEELVRKDLGE